LQQGDAFASSVLVTGCPISDPKGTFGLLARGLRPKYTKADIISNAHRRCQLRWLRLCALRNVDKTAFRRACQQWVLTLMQLALVQRKAPASLLQASLLGNARHVIREFVQHFRTADESFFLNLVRITKGLSAPPSKDWPDMKELVDSVYDPLQPAISSEESDLLESRIVQQADVSGSISKVYAEIETLLSRLVAGKTRASLPGNEEEQLSLVLNRSNIRDWVSSFDWLFFFELHHSAVRQGFTAQHKEFSKVIDAQQKRWKQGKWAAPVPERKRAAKSVKSGTNPRW